MDRVETARLQLSARSVLRALKATRTYDELAAETGLSAGDLNRYVNGHVLPGADRARAIVEAFGREEVARALDERLRVDHEGYVDTTAVVFDVPLLDRVASIALQSVDIDRPDVVLTAATDGITFGSSLARQLDARCTYAKKNKETAVEEFIEARGWLTDGVDLTYYLPEGAVASGATVLVADDLIRSGETQALLLDIATAAGAEIIGVLALIAVGDEGLERVREQVEAPVEALLSVER